MGVFGSIDKLIITQVVHFSRFPSLSLSRTHTGTGTGTPAHYLERDCRLDGCICYRKQDVTMPIPQNAGKMEERRRVQKTT